MQFLYTDPQTDFERVVGGFYCINAIGRVNPGDDERFKDFLLKSVPPAITTVYVDSSGGDVEAAIGIGKLIRSWRFQTSIGKYIIDYQSSGEFILRRKLLPGSCMSAATLLFLGGTLRYFPEGSRFGVHQFSLRDPSPENAGQSQILSAVIAQYIVDMGISPEFLGLSASVNSREIEQVCLEDLERLKVITGGQTEVSWTIQAVGKMLYVRGERYSLHGHHKVMLGFTKVGGFFFWSVIEAQGREEELTRFLLVEIVIDDEEIKIDISDRKSVV